MNRDHEKDSVEESDAHSDIMDRIDRLNEEELEDVLINLLSHDGSKTDSKNSDTKTDFIDNIRENIDDELIEENKDGIQIKMSPYSTQEFMSNMLYATNYNISQLTVYGSKLYRLYNEIKEVDAHEPDNPPGLNPQEMQDMDYFLRAETAKRVSISEEVVLYYTIGTELINKLLISLLRDTVIDDDRWSNSAQRFVSRNLEPNQRLSQLLYYAGEIDNGLHSDIGEAKKMRNNLVHNLDEHGFLESMDNINQRIDEVRRSVEGLHEVVYGNELEDRIEREIFDRGEE